ncbi:HNH endonuclease [Vibrio phage D260]
MRELVEEAFEILESQYSPQWRGGKGSKENLIDAFSQCELPPHEYLGYKGSDGLRHAFGRALGYSVKPKHTEWTTWVYSLVGYYLCRQCNTLVPLSEKATKGSCKKCDAQGSGSRRLLNRERLYNYLRENPCTDCGEENPIVLEFDHVDPNNKSDNISNMMSKSWENIKEEIDKCEVVCANCHRIRTAKQFNWYSFLQE